jgi:hypothetical protein
MHSDRCSFKIGTGITATAKNVIALTGNKQKDISELKQVWCAEAVIIFSDIAEIVRAFLCATIRIHSASSSDLVAISASQKTDLVFQKLLLERKIGTHRESNDEITSTRSAVDRPNRSCWYRIERLPQHTHIVIRKDPTRTCDRDCPRGRPRHSTFGSSCPGSL